jgi:AcrR family transcriptional regulator
MTPPKRAYHSPARAAAAQETRRRISEAARLLFAERGYAGTTLEAVAAQAGVALQTVRQVFGGKSGLMAAQLDAIDQIGGVGELRAVVEDAAATPAQKFAALARFLRRLFEGAGDTLEAARTAGGADPALKALVEGGNRRHRMGVSGLVAQLAQAGVLAEGLDAPQAAAIAASVSGHDVYRTLQNEWNWTPEQYEAWLPIALERLILSPQQSKPTAAEEA